MLLQVSRGAVPSSPVELVMNATRETQIVLGLLIALSLLSWGIMFAVWGSLGKATRAAEKLRYEFERASRLDEAGLMARRASPGALRGLSMRAVHLVADMRGATERALELAQPA